MATVIPRHVLCILGEWDSLDAVDAIVGRFGAGFQLDRDFSQLSPDARMERSFEASHDRVNPSMTEEDWQAVGSHSAVAYILSPPIHREQALVISGQALVLTAALLGAGGLAAKGESSGIAHGKARWRELGADLALALEKSDEPLLGATLYWAWVRRPLLDEEGGVLYSCGMHLLGEPDLEIDSSLELDTALEWMDLLGLYFVADRPERPIREGEGFRLHDSGPRRILRLGPCRRYEEDDFFFNPYGTIRLEEEDSEE